MIPAKSANGTVALNPRKDYGNDLQVLYREKNDDGGEQDDHRQVEPTHNRFS
jgi:hypothetical protein